MINKIAPILLLFCTFLEFSGCSDTKNQKDTPTTVSVDTTENQTEKFVVDLEVSKKEVHKKIASQIDEILDKLSSRKQFNGAMLIAEDGKIIYNSVKGKGNYNKDVDLELTTAFHLASVSKQFTAMAIMMLEEEGKLKYSDTINQYFRDFPYEGITIEQLLNHTSGVPDVSEYIPQFLGFWDTCKIAVNQDVLYMLNNVRPGIKFYPGRRFSYSNTGYILLALIIEKVSGLPYQDFLENRIFKPLNMQNTFVYDIGDLNSCPSRANAYNVYRYTYVPYEDDIRNGLVGEKGIYSSVIDLFKWDQALYTERLVSKETLEKAFSKGKSKSGRLVNYGYGWRIPRKENNIVYHFGYWKGSRAGLIRILDDKYTIIILNNTSSRRLRYIVRKTIGILYEGRKDKPKF